MTQISAKVFGRWNRKIAALASLSDVAQIPERLIDALNMLIESDQRLIVVFGENCRPVKLFDSSIHDWPEEDLETYMQGAYLLDPYYRAAVAGVPSGVYPLADVAPEGFHESQYYKNYYRKTGIEHELGFIVDLPDNCFANISFARIRSSREFGDRHKVLLWQTLPVVKELLSRYWRLTSESRKESGSELYAQLECALEIFATSILTPREAEIMRMYLYGYETKSIAERLSISAHTVSMHRKNFYAKLDIGSQAELFRLFISSMYCYAGNPTIDPLESYLQIETS